MKKLAALFSGLCVIVILTALLGLRWFNQEIAAPGPLAAEKLVVIAPGLPTRGITDKLLEEGVIASPAAFLLDARLQGRLAPLKAGEYQIPARATIAGIIALLQSGKTYQHHITIPEGLLSLEIVDLLKKETALTGAIDPRPADGTLLPETYNFTYGDTRAGVIARMQKAMRDAVDDAWEKRSPDVRLSKEEAVVLASIVEKETGLAAERPRVAGVFLNRLHRGIPLQSDPTVIYSLTLGQTAFDRPITAKDLRNPSPFNTYLASGLPPAPIANPGKASLAAVLNPEKHDFIYFVADGSGGHAFAKTLQEHNRNVAQWRKIEKGRN